MNLNELNADELRRELVAMAIEWERRYGVCPAITCAVSEFDAARLVGHSPDSFGRDCEHRTAVTRGADFCYGGLRYQVKANRPSGRPGSPVTLVAKAVSPRNCEQIRYAFAVFCGLVHEVYEVHGCVRQALCTMKRGVSRSKR